ncbi:hypothetical protein E2I14_19040, partial [Sapientia aquatica]
MTIIKHRVCVVNPRCLERMVAVFNILGTKGQRVLYRRFLSWMLVLAIQLVGADSACAQSINSTGFRHVDIDNGIADPCIISITQDKWGFIWFGNQTGLSRFDGFHSIVFKHKDGDSRSLASNWVKALYVDKSGVLWVGSRSGLQKFDNDTETFTTFSAAPEGPHDDARNNVEVIIGDGKDGLWIGTTGGLLHFNRLTGQFKRFKHLTNEPSSLSGNSVNALALDSNGNLWIGTDAGLDQLQPNQSQFLHHRLDNTSSENIIHSLLLTKNNQLWIGLSDGLKLLTLDANMEIKTLVLQTFLWVKSTLSRRFSQRRARWKAKICIRRCWGCKSHGRL